MESWAGWIISCNQIPGRNINNLRYADDSTLMAESKDELNILLMKVKEESESESRSAVSNSLRHHGLYSPWNSPSQNTGVGSLSLIQGIFPTQGLNPGLPHCRQILYQLKHTGNPRRVKKLTWNSTFKKLRSWHPVPSLHGKQMGK